MTDSTCTVDGCDKDVRTKGYCYGHYMKLWRYGTPTPEHSDRWEDLSGKRFGTLTATIRRDGGKWDLLCDCGRSTVARSGDLRRGTKLHCDDKALHRRQEHAGYVAAHQRVRQDRGRAATHSCVDCDGGAQHWSYDHSDPGELLDDSVNAGPLPYSLDTSRYQPRCIPCHKKFDMRKGAKILPAA